MSTYQLSDGHVDVTLTGLQNINVINYDKWHFTKVGDMVQVSGQFTAEVTTVGVISKIEIELTSPSFYVDAWVSQPSGAGAIQDGSLGSDISPVRVYGEMGTNNFFAEWKSNTLSELTGNVIFSFKVS